MATKINGGVYAGQNLTGSLDYFRLEGVRLNATEAEVSTYFGPGNYISTIVQEQATVATDGQGNYVTTLDSGRYSSNRARFNDTHSQGVYAHPFAEIFKEFNRRAIVPIIGLPSDGAPAEQILSSSITPMTITDGASGVTFANTSPEPSLDDGSYGPYTVTGIAQGTGLEITVEINGSVITDVVITNGGAGYNPDLADDILGSIGLFIDSIFGTVDFSISGAVLAFDTLTSPASEALGAGSGECSWAIERLRLWEPKAEDIALYGTGGVAVAIGSNGDTVTYKDVTAAAGTLEQRAANLMTNVIRSIGIIADTSTYVSETAIGNLSNGQTYEGQDYIDLREAEVFTGIFNVV